MPGIPGKEKQIGIETWEKKVPSERRYQTGCIAHVKGPLFFVLFLLSLGKSLTEKFLLI